MPLQMNFPFYNGKNQVSEGKKSSVRILADNCISPNVYRSPCWPVRNYKKKKGTHWHFRYSKAHKHVTGKNS